MIFPHIVLKEIFEYKSHHRADGKVSFFKASIEDIAKESRT